MNKAIIMGRTGTEPEMKHLPSGSAVCNFSIATSEKFTDKAGVKQEKTEWHRIVTFGKTAEICQKYLGKGSQVLIEGKIQTRSWDDKDGKKCYATEIVASEVRFIGGDKKADKPQASAEATFTSDEIPF